MEDHGKDLEMLGSRNYNPVKKGGPVQQGTCGEVRVTDPTTGGQKGTKLARFALLPFDALWKVAEHYGIGANKYEDRNWERGYRWSLSYDALLRHLAADMHGEERDPETGSLHITAVVWHALALLTYRLRGVGTDDRSKPYLNQRAMPYDEKIRQIQAARQEGVYSPSGGYLR